ncbi:heat shock 22 kDa protein, mitochondrial-like isoform X2 [Vigna unguiculata]|uniref:HSP20 family protein n=1 Tax=Vigna unguiculata TaxID=3917 RepID=A0A4D6LKN2_VIGUN|nr:heat shock 22 kDa protein, mitochondrial-like isoform X2 [Vigna unguiculata]QCD88905.1 HSP20 family protein [Vigna unguiculata]
MASSLIAKRFFSSSLLSKSLLRPAASASRSFNTNAMRNYDNQNDDVERHSERYYPRTARRDDIFSDVLDPFFPTRSLSQVLNMMDQFIDNPFLSSPRGIGAGAGARRGWDARETEDALLLRVDMPGLGKEDVKISVEQNTLTIKGEGAKEGDEEESARRYTSRIDLPDKIYKVDQIKAEMKNGVLKVVLPKMKEEEKRDVINVNVE